MSMAVAVATVLLVAGAGAEGPCDIVETCDYRDKASREQYCRDDADCSLGRYCTAFSECYSCDSTSESSRYAIDDDCCSASFGKLRQASSKIARQIRITAQLFHHLDCEGAG